MARKRRTLLGKPKSIVGSSPISLEPKPNDHPGNILIVPPYPLYRTVVLYAFTWIFFFLIPLYIIYSSLTKDSFSISEFAIVAYLSLMIIIRFGAVGSLPHVVVISGLLFATQAHPQIHALVDLIWISQIGLYSFFFVRNFYHLQILQKNLVNCVD